MQGSFGKCGVCRQPLRGRDTVGFTAAGRLIFATHAEPCAGVVHLGTRACGALLLFGAQEILRRKAPRLGAFIETVAKVRRQRELEEQRHVA